MSAKNAKPKKPMSDEIKSAWESYWDDKDPAAKNILIDHYSFLVNHITRPFWHKKPFLLDHSDLISAGTIGLIQAIERFDRSRGFMFETFAQLRIRGAILDEINSLDWTPRSVRKNIRTVLKAEEQILSSGDEPSSEAISKITGMSPETVQQSRHQAMRTYVLPVNQESLREIESQLNEHEVERAFSHLVGMIKSPNSKNTWTSLIQDLTKAERSVILLRFYYDETMVKTAKILQMSPNTVSLIQHSALAKLKARLNEEDYSDER